MLFRYNNSLINSVDISRKECIIALRNVYLRQILSGKHKGGFYPAPYVDRFGEADVDLTRGNPLKLDKAQYQKLNKMWQHNDLQTYIAKSQRALRIRDHQLDLGLNWFQI